MGRHNGTHQITNKCENKDTSLVLGTQIAHPRIWCLRGLGQECIKLNVISPKWQVPSFNPDVLSPKSNVLSIKPQVLGLKPNLSSFKTSCPRY